jgi:prepilin-type N-terminal cleavage/methylation domain-containing protein
MKKTKKGFTLIELLVVISIISLLSSVVLVGVGGTRNKAKEKAFRSEIMQFVNALELYRNDNGGKYPFEVDSAVSSFPYFYSGKNNPLSAPLENTDYTSSFNLSSAMSKYMKTLPNPRGSDVVNAAWVFVVNSPNTFNAKYRCKGDSVVPKYVIHLESTFWGSGFEDWPIAQLSYTNFTTVPSDLPSTHCFSLK